MYFFADFTKIITTKNNICLRYYHFIKLIRWFVIASLLNRSQWFQRRQNMYTMKQCLPKIVLNVCHSKLIISCQFFFKVNQSHEHGHKYVLYKQYPQLFIKQNNKLKIPQIKWDKHFTVNTSINNESIELEIDDCSCNSNQLSSNCVGKKTK